MANMTNDVFNPDIWTSELEHELNAKLIFDKWTTRKYEGLLKQAGDQVRIFGIGHVSVNELDWSKEEDREKFEGGLEAPVKGNGTSMTLTVNKIIYYTLKENDLEKKLRDRDTWGAYKEDCVDQMKDKVDNYIAMKAATEFPAYNTTAVKITVNNVGKTVASMKTALYKKNVSTASELKMEVPFEFLQVLEESYEGHPSASQELLKSGKVVSEESSKRHGVIFEASNNCYSTTSGDTVTYYLSMRTKRALAFVNRVQFSEMIRNTNGFSDILRGYCLYDAKVVKPKEGLVLKCTIDTETDKIIKTKAVS